jgi:hypothetical protein
VYKNALKNRRFDRRTDAHGEFQAVSISTRQVSAVVDKFRAKYGAGDVQKYYSNFDVAVVVETE